MHRYPQLNSDKTTEVVDKAINDIICHPIIHIILRQPSNTKHLFNTNSHYEVYRRGVETGSWPEHMNHPLLDLSKSESSSTDISKFKNGIIQLKSTFNNMDFLHSSLERGKTSSTTEMMAVTWPTINIIQPALQHHVVWTELFWYNFHTTLATLMVNEKLGFTIQNWWHVEYDQIQTHADEEIW